MSENRSTTPQEPTHKAAFVCVPIDQIRPYDADPRRGDNPEFDRIKALIRAHGVDQALVATQGSGESDYMVHSGGNTRLLALRELYQEAGEVDVLLAHLRENDLRDPVPAL